MSWSPRRPLQVGEVQLQLVAREVGLVDERWMLYNIKMSLLEIIFQNFFL